MVLPPFVGEQIHQKKFLDHLSADKFLKKSFWPHLSVNKSIKKMKLGPFRRSTASFKNSLGHPPKGEMAQ